MVIGVSPSRFIGLHEMRDGFKRFGSVMQNNGRIGDDKSEPKSSQKRHSYQNIIRGVVEQNRAFHRLIAQAYSTLSNEIIDDLAIPEHD